MTKIHHELDLLCGFSSDVLLLGNGLRGLRRGDQSFGASFFFQHRPSIDLLINSYTAPCVALSSAMGSFLDFFKRSERVTTKTEKPESTLDRKWITMDKKADDHPFASAH